MPTINPYINFGGQARDALAFYQTIFGGQADILAAKDSMPADKIKDGAEDLVFHSSLHGGDFHIMASDMATPSEGLIQGNSIAMTLNCNGEDETRSYFDKLSAGGEVAVPLQESDWHSLFGQVKDRFGIIWMIDGTLEKA